jgi:hypothetical protein
VRRFDLDHLGQPHALRGDDPETLLSLAHHWSEDGDEVRTFPHELAAALRSLMGGSAGVSTAIDEAAKPR